MSFIKKKLLVYLDVVQQLENYHNRILIVKNTVIFHKQ